MSIKCCHYYVPPKRHTACWGTCPDYLKELAEDQAEKEAIRKKREDEDRVFSTRSRARFVALQKYKKY